jgi:hypothetical protein
MRFMHKTWKQRRQERRDRREYEEIMRRLERVPVTPEQQSESEGAIDDPFTGRRRKRPRL